MPTRACQLHIERVILRQSYLVTGGAGFIGSQLCDALLAQDHRVVVLDNLCSGKRSNLSAADGDITFIQGDVRNITEHAAAIGPVDAIIHLAALISGYDSLTTPDEYEDVNVTGLHRVIEFAVERKIKRIVFASSSTVYGNKPGVKLSETDLPQPQTVYALTKLSGEHLLRLYGQMHGFSQCSLRLFNVYGPRQSPNHPYANVTCKFSHAAANGLPVMLYGDGDQSRDFVYIGDVIQAFLAVLGGSKQAIYNIGLGKDRSINDLIDALGRIEGEPLRTVACPPWENDIRSICADTSRFESEFGFRPEIDLEQGLTKTIAFFKDKRGT